jgi:hypothetical protein
MMYMLSIRGSLDEVEEVNGRGSPKLLHFVPVSVLHEDGLMAFEDLRELGSVEGVGD